MRKSQYFPFQCWVLNKGTTGTLFITSLVWRGPWLWIEPGTSRTRSQHYTTRLSRRRYCISIWWIDIIRQTVTCISMGYLKRGSNFYKLYRCSSRVLLCKRWLGSLYAFVKKLFDCTIHMTITSREKNVQHFWQTG